MAAVAHQILYRGSAPTLRFTMTTNGSVAGWTTLLSLRITATAADPPALTKAGSIADAGSASTPGIFEVPLTKAETVLLDKRIHAFSLTRTDAGFEDVLTIGTLDTRYDIRHAA